MKNDYDFEIFSSRPDHYLELHAKIKEDFRRIHQENRLDKM
jgi:hypothetical protein